MEDTGEEDPIDYTANAITYGHIIFKSDLYYIYSSTLPDGSTYTVEVNVCDVPPSHHDVPCQELLDDSAREIADEYTRLRNEQRFSILAGEKLPISSKDDIVEGPAKVLTDVMAEAENTCDQSTDDELWTGCRSLKKKAADLVASTKLLDIIKERWEEVTDKKIPRRTVFATIARKLRLAGVRVHRDPGKTWFKIYSRWNKLKDYYITNKDSVAENGRGASKPPALYEELHELLGSRAIVKPKALSSSLPTGKRVRQCGRNEEQTAIELELIRKENEDLVADGMITAEEAREATEAAAAISGIDPEPTKKSQAGGKRKTTDRSSFQPRGIKVVRDGKEQKKMEMSEKRQKELDGKIAQRDSFVHQAEAQKIKIANSLVEVLSALVNKTKKKKRRRSSSSSTTSSS